MRGTCKLSLGCLLGCPVKFPICRVCERYLIAVGWLGWARGKGRA